MSNHLPKQLRTIGLSLSIPSILVTEVARSQSNRNASPDTLPTAAEINKKIQQNYPPELLGESTVNPNQPAEGSVDGQNADATRFLQKQSINVQPNNNSTAIGTSTYTFILPTPALIAVVALVGSLALFPVVHLLLNSKKAVEIGKNSIWSKWMDRFQKPKVLESDAFLHQRNFDKLTQIAAQSQNLDADKFGNTDLNLLEVEDLLNLDALLLLVMSKYEVFEKLGPIVGVTEENNRPETYSKMLQYIGLKKRHEVSYQKFQELLVTLKQWDIHSQTIMNVRGKYNTKEYQLPKNFIVELPGADIYKKYKDSFHLITQSIPQQQSQLSVKDVPVLVDVK
jgi:hypothetical protein